jgi:microcystin-dependent protein
MSTIDPSLLESIFSITYSYAPDPGDTISYTRARVNINNVDTINCRSLNYSNIQFGDASGNLFVGDVAGCNSTLTSNCTGIGEESMDFLTGGSNVTGLGFSSLRNTASLTRVIAIGTFAGDSNSNVADTVIIGDSAARNLSSATSNVIIGSGAGASLTGGTNNILIGAGVDPVVGSNNNVFNIGNTISGITGSTIYTAGAIRAGGDIQIKSGDSFTIYSPGSPDVTRSRYTTDTNGRTYFQTLSDFAFTQIGTGSTNTILTISSGTGGDVFSVDGTISATSFQGNNLSIAGTISATSFQGNNLSIGGTISASTMVGKGTIPIGGIIMWSGDISSIPTGWALCDGTNGTPNLLDRFIIGAGGSYAVGTISGSSTQTLSVSNLPPHSHDATVLTAGYVASYNNDSEIMSVNRSNGTFTYSTATTGSGTAFSILPPYYALAYIMRTV